MKKTWLALVACTMFGFMAQAQVDLEPVSSREQQKESAQIDEYVKIDLADLPPAVIKTVSEKYNEAAIKEAYFNKEKSIYKLILIVEKVEVEVLFNPEGQILE